MSIENLNPTFGKRNFIKKMIDPWDNEKETGIESTSIIHIRTQARNGRKKVTTVQGLPKNTVI
jgi:translation initiation factor 1 (eIF-1/SUI1)